MASPGGMPREVLPGEGTGEYRNAICWSPPERGGCGCACAQFLTSQSQREANFLPVDRKASKDLPALMDHIEYLSVEMNGSFKLPLSPTFCILSCSRVIASFMINSASLHWNCGIVFVSPYLLMLL